MTWKETENIYKLLQITFILILLVCTNVYGRTLKDFPEECFTASEIDDDTRAFDNHNVPTSKADDLDLKKGWYRIMGKKTNSLKQGFDKAVGNEANAPNFCGTVFAGTLMGEHPTEDEGLVEMTVCFRRRFCFYRNIDSCDCKFTKTIFVRNCRNHYIYWLTPTNSQARYCTGRTSMKPVTSIKGVSNAIECKQHKTLQDQRMWNKILDVRCDSDNGGWYRFSATSGSELASQCSVNNESISRLAQPCGAAFRGWMVDRHPTLIEGRRNSRICFSYPNSCSCEFYSSIAVRNCSSFYVYRFHSPPLCNAKYCGSPVGVSAAVNDLSKPPNVKRRNICTANYQVLHDPSRLWSYTSPTGSNCDSRLFGYYRFGSRYTPWSVKQGCRKNDMNTVTHRCGTRYQGFMEDRHPTVSEGYVERIVCFQDAKVPCECHFSTTIGVQNCSGFYVYEFRGVPQCQSRICMVANGSDILKIDVDRPPMFDIPVPGYTVFESAKHVTPGNDDVTVTTTVLCIIILIVLIVIVIVILTVLYVAHPVLWPRKRRNKKEKVTDSESDPSNQLLVEECLPDHQYSSLPDAPPEQEDDIEKRPDSEDEVPHLDVDTTV